MLINSLLGTTVRDLVFLVQDSGREAAAAQNQLLESHAALIRAAAHAYPSVPQAEKVARTAFLDAIRNFRFSTNASVASYCWMEMSSALKRAAVARKQPRQLPLLLEAIPTSVKVADLQLLSRIATTQRTADNITNFRLSA